MSTAPTSAAPERASDSPLLHFFDAFLQERNIKWLLAIGSLILLSSSLMLVGSHWNNYAPVWQFFIMLGYCAALYQAALWTYYRLALRRTGTGLMTLTLGLMPALFFALALLQENPLQEGNTLLALALLGLSSAFALLAARRILEHFLRGPQPTFLIAYLALSAAYAVLPLLSPNLQTLSLFGLWLIVCAGTVKVSRHVFWLTEELQSPRIFGFFPVALLVALYVGLGALYAVDHIALEWLGLGCTLAAVPVLLSADALHKVFLQRSGGLLNERPVAVMLPVLFGLIVAISGVALAGAGFMPGHSLLALTPTALIAAALIFIVAWRSQLSALVWLALILFTVGYNFAPAYFATLAVQVIDSGAALVAEPKLPYGFYGLSYLPLIVILSIGAVWSRRREIALLSQPLRGFSVLLSVLMLALAFTHGKALLPVAAVLTLVFTAQTYLYRSRWLGNLAIVAFLSAVIGVETLSYVYCCLPFDAWWTDSANTLLLAAGFLLLIAPKVDPYLAALPSQLSKAEPYLLNCARASLVISAILIVPMLLESFSQISPFAWGLAGLLMMHAVRLSDWRCGALTLVYLHALLWLFLDLGLPTSWGSLFTVDVLIVNGALLLQWGLGYVWRRYPQSRLSRAFGPVNDGFALIGLLAAMVVVHIPNLALVYLDVIDIGVMGSLASALTAVWALDAARRFRQSALVVMGFVLGFTILGAVLLSSSLSPLWLPLVWTISALMLLALLADTGFLARALRQCSWGILLMVVALSLAVYQLPIWIAGVTASLGALGLAWVRRQKLMGMGGLVLLNAQLLALTLILSTPVPVTTIFDLDHWYKLADGRYELLLTLCALPLAMAAGLSRLLWMFLLHAPESAQPRLFKVWQKGLEALTFIGLWLALDLSRPNAWQVSFVVIAFAALAGRFMVQAYRNGQSTQVWQAEGVLLAGGAYLAWHGVIEFGQGWSPWLALAGAALTWLLAQMAQRRAPFAAFVQPLQQTALALPGVAVGLLLYRHSTHFDATWLGRDSLALLLAAGAYAWYGYSYRQRSALLLALGLCNLLLLSIWHELSWTDPQFYLIPIGVSILSLRALFREQLPPRWRDPLNYLGALIILVSPLFNIVNGSWWHIFSLMLISLAVIVVAIGFRIRALLYTGAAFLLADLIAMVVLGGLDNPSVLWLAGLALGGAVLAMAALAERGREDLILRLQAVSAALAEWK